MTAPLPVLRPGDSAWDEFANSLLAALGGCPPGRCQGDHYAARSLLTERGYDVLGIDIAPDMIALEAFLMWRARGMPMDAPGVRP